MHLEIASHSAWSGLIISDVVRRGLQLCVTEFPLSERMCACWLHLQLPPLPGTLLVVYSVAVAQSSVGQVPQCAGCTLALCWSVLPGLCLTASCPAWCGTPGEVTKTEMYYPRVTDRDPAHTEMWLFQDENSVARLGKELYLLYLPPFFPTNKIIFFISLTLLFVKSKVR